MASIRMRDGRAQVLYRDPDGRQRSKTFLRKTDARAFASEVESQMRRREWLDPSSAEVTFAEIVEKWWATASDLEPTTKSQHEVALRLHLLPRFGRRAVGSISDFDVRQLKSDLLALGRAPSTVTKYLQILSKIMNAAVLNGHIYKNPCARVAKAGEEAVRETIFLTAEELNDLADAMNPRFAPMVYLAGYRGLRFGECAGLRPGRVNLLRCRIQIIEALKEADGQPYFGLPKHKRRRDIAIPPFLKEILEGHLEAFPSKNDLIFTNPDGTLLRRSNFQRRIWMPAVRLAGVDDRLTFHGLRHSAVSILVAEGAQVPELAEIFGWARSTAVAMELRYSHLFRAREEELTLATEQAYRRARRNSQP